MKIPYLRTILGDIQLENLGLILPHEHLFTDLRGPELEYYAQADSKIVLSAMLPFLKEAQDAGVTGFVECSTIGVGRNINILRTLAEHTSIHILAPTGIYREAYTPSKYQHQTIDEMAELFVLELTRGIDDGKCKAGFIKIALSDDGPRPIEERNIRAAARASKATSAAIASHTIGGKAAMQEISILLDEGLNLEKFIWVHANIEPDQDFHYQAASKGAYIEFDSIGSPSVDPDMNLRAILNLLNKGYGNRILLSHDAGWYQPGRPGGKPEQGFRGYIALTQDFIPRLKGAGVDLQTIQTLTQDNPKRVFSMTV